MYNSEKILQALSPIRHRLLSPALVIDLDAVEHNIRQFISRIGDAIHWRPHIKTNKQAVVIRSLLDHGIRHFKCATVDELQLLQTTLLNWRSHNKQSDRCEIMLAYPATEAICLWLSSNEEFNQSRNQDPWTSIQLLADSPSHLQLLSKQLESFRLLQAFPIFFDVNIGMNRTGATSEIWTEAIKCRAISPELRIAGIHGYDGHIHWQEKEKAHRGYETLCSLAQRLEDYSPEKNSTRQIVGSGTHSYHHALSCVEFQRSPWLQQVSPGTIIFSDLRSDKAADDLDLHQAAFVISRVISLANNQITIDAGSKAIAPDCPSQCCRIASHPSLNVKQASEEHLTFEVSNATFHYGDILALVPAHVCTTVNMYREALWIREGRFVGSGPICNYHSTWAAPH